MRQPSTTRRRLLRFGAAAAGGGTLASTAGCLAAFRPPSYRTWLPAPSAIGTWNYEFSVLKPDELLAREDAFPPHVDFSTMDVLWEPARIDPRDVSVLVRRHGVRVVLGSFDRDAVRADFDGFREHGEHAGFTLVADADVGAGAAIGDGALVVAGLAFSRVDDPVPVIEAYVDAHVGRADRYGDASEALDETLSYLGDGQFLRARTTVPPAEPASEYGQFAGLNATGHRKTIDGDRTRGTWVRHVEQPGSLTRADLRSWVAAERERGDQFTDWRGFSYETTSRAGIVTAVSDIGRL